MENNNELKNEILENNQVDKTDQQVLSQMNQDIIKNKEESESLKKEDQKKNSGIISRLMSFLKGEDVENDIINMDTFKKDAKDITTISLYSLGGDMGKTGGVANLNKYVKKYELGDEGENIISKIKEISIKMEGVDKGPDRVQSQEELNSQKFKLLSMMREKAEKLETSDIE